MKHHYFSFKTSRTIPLILSFVALLFCSFQLRAKTLTVLIHPSASVTNLSSKIADPVIEDQTLSLDEASPKGTSVGQVKATDDGSIATYEIISAEFLRVDNPPQSDSPEDPEYNAKSVFSLDSKTGQLKVNNNKYLLAVLGPIKLKVEVTDNDGAKASADITVNVKDLEVSIEKEYTLDWSEVAPHPRGNQEATGGFVNGKLYVFGGFKESFAPKDDVDVYDPITDKWSKLKEMPPMADDSGAGGATHMGWAQDGTNMYIAAGYAADKTGNRQQFGSRRVYRYNVAEDTYTELPEFPLDRAGGALKFLDNKLYYIGGSNRARTVDQGNVLMLDLDNLNAGWTKRSPLPNPRNHIGSAIYEGQIYIFGGQKSQDEKLVPQDDVHRYDPATDTWTHITDMPKPFNHIHTSVFTYGDLIYSVGGQIGHNKGAYANVYAYKPKTNEWFQFTDLPKKRYAIVSDAFDGRIYASGGNNSRTTFTAMIPEEILGIEEANNGSDLSSSEIKLYPNPSRDELFVQTEKAEITIKILEIVDLNGRIILKQNANLSTKGAAIKIVTSSLSAGMYLLKVHDVKGEVHTSRFMVE